MERFDISGVWSGFVIFWFHRNPRIHPAVLRSKLISALALSIWITNIQSTNGEFANDCAVNDCAYRVVEHKNTFVSTVQSWNRSRMHLSGHTTCVVRSYCIPFLQDDSKHDGCWNCNVKVTECMKWMKDFGADIGECRTSPRGRLCLSLHALHETWG